MIGYYNYTVIATYLSLAVSCAGILFAVRANIPAALCCLMLSGLIDGFDGRIAQTKKDRTPAERRFGIQIDSLCDLVCFGVLPAVICMNMGRYRIWELAALLLYILCAQIRLAFYNVQEEERQQAGSGRRKYYNGMPVTSVSLILPAVYLLCRYFPSISDFLPACVIFVCAVLFISPIRIPKAYKFSMAVMLLLGIAEGAGLIAAMI